MKSNLILTRHSNSLRLPLGLSIMVLVILGAAGLMRTGQASSASPVAAPFAGDTCAQATVISPSASSFTEDASLSTATNNIDPGLGGCAPGAGNDLVYSFTPSSTDTYTIGATPTAGFDLSLYIVTDCANPVGTCVAGANAVGFGRGEFLATTLNAGTQYFIVVDSVIQDPSANGFHFSLRRGVVSNVTCATAAVIDTSRLPFSTSSTTFGAGNDIDPGQSCFTSTQSTRGADVVYQFTPGDTQLYNITVTPFGDFDISLYLTTDCSTIANCIGRDVGGPGFPETILQNLIAGTTYFIVVDGFGGDAGDFTFSLTPSILRSPAPPTNLTATAISPTQIDLAWQDNSGDEQGFRIERSLDALVFAEVATVTTNVTTFSDTTVSPDTLYFYRVFAFNNFGNSEPSNIAFAQTPPSPIPVTPVIVVEPTSIDFGSVRITQSDTRTVTITNGGAADLVISSIADPIAPFSIVNKPALPLTIPSTQSVTLTVRFSPTVIGPASGSFTIGSNDPLRPIVSITLTGNGTGAPVPNLVTSLGLVDFGTSTTAIMFELSNTGEADLTIASILPPRAPFSLSGGGTGTIKSGEKKTITIAFSPTSIGVFTSGFTIVSNDPDSLLTFIPIRGTSLVQTVVPRIVGLEFRKKGLRFQAAGSNVVAGATLIVDGTETFVLTQSGDFWQVTKKVRSTPGGKRVRDIFVSPSTHSVVVKNPNGGTSTAVNLSV
ncbi:MAG TPA: choice-of-anchor D domain-containing protein [Blastocatellia bacterium]|nr:choice-of-anchor D domain-containing protein [Blastocatellia bacterium]